MGFDVMGPGLSVGSQSGMVLRLQENLIDWLPGWEDPAASGGSVYQTVIGQEDCTLGMLGNDGSEGVTSG